MRLTELAAAVPHHLRAGGASNPEILTLTHDSRKVRPGALFAAFPGLKADGRAFIAEAVSRGASAALGEAPAPETLAVPYLEVANARRAAGILAARLAGDPCEKLVMAGLTGTSGKTTTSLLLDAVLAEGHPVRGLFGTLVYRGATGEVEASRTTPEATELAPLLAELVANGGTAVTMECSSHALSLERLAGTRFDVAAFLNLSRDHLDFHAGLDDYFEAKALLFSLLKPSGHAVVNVDDPYGARLAERLVPVLGASRVVSFSLRNESRATVLGSAGLLEDGIRLTITSSRYSISGSDLVVTSPLLGRPNAENLLAAAACALALEVTPSSIAHALAAVVRVPGRLEPVSNDLGLRVLVDYAHKPGALEGVLRTTRSLAASSSGRVVLVFGCGGDRDRGKRPEMGRIAGELADVVVVTSDNPRSENPESILDEIRPGVSATSAKDVRYLVDRRVAIREALALARPGDVVLIAGKGHETTQLIGGVSHPFDDRVVAKELLDELSAARSAHGSGA